MAKDPVRTFHVDAVAILRATFQDENGDIADPDTNVTLIILNPDDTELSNVTEPIGALVLFENPSTGVYQFRHTVVEQVAGRERDEVWRYRWKSNSTTPPAPTAVSDTERFRVSPVIGPNP